MARARNIKPGFFKNEDLAECTPFARLCFAGLWTMADREGRLEDRPKRIKGELFPYDSVEVEPLLEELARWGFIRRYQVGGERFIFIIKFVEHQAPHGTEKDGSIPDENGFLTIHERGKNGYITGNHRLEPHVLTVKEHGQTSSQPQGNNDALTVKTPNPEGGQNTLIPDSGFLIPDSLNPIPLRGCRFAEFWALWPKTDRKTAKAECEKRWKARGLDAEADAIFAHVAVMKTSDTWRRGFEPAPLTYLNQRRWEDGNEGGSANEGLDADLYRGAR